MDVGGAVPSVEEPVVEAMPFDDYLRLPDDLRAEYADGAVVMAPPPSYHHQKVCQRLTRLLEDVCAGRYDVVAGAGWELRPGRGVRIPDVMVLDEPPARDRVVRAPLVTVEVLSGNRADDLVRKSTEYLEAGAGQYWVVDPRDGTIDVFDNRGGWRSVARLTSDSPVAVVTIGDEVEVAVDVRVVLGEEDG